MEVLFGGALLRSKSSNRAIPSTTNKTRNLSTGDVGYKMENMKRRGVYVEKWVNPKLPAEDNKRHKSKAQPIPRPQTSKLLTSAPKESNISTYTRLLGTTDPAVRFIKRKKRTLPEKLPKQSSKTSKQSKHENKPRNIVEDNKNMNKFRQNHAKDAENITSPRKVLQTPSTSSKLTRDLSSDTNWSTIFPKRDNTNLLQQYICNYDESKPKDNDDKLKKAEGKKDEQIYTFFKDLIESVYDEEVATNPDVQSGKSSDIKFEIDDPVAQKLQEYNSKQYTIEDKDFAYDQSRELADYYNNKSRLTPQKSIKRRKKNIRKYTFTDKSAYSKEESRPKKPNLLNLLKQQLAIDLTMQEEPESMYEALLNIAKNKRKRKQIYFETTKEPSDIERVCRFKRRNVLSPSPRMPKRVRQTSRYDSKTTAGIKRFESDTSIEFESSHSLEVLGFDYDVIEPETEPSEIETAISKIKSITNLNEGITTVTHHWIS
ncbi:uncharacterized protein LOC133532382 [Cydia pomonella]|uniref:uncharacterized protein LOC133532382 n=1 Tax=Cydia pomonella TaxID=82600 RepID=UPI002ADDD7FA|nr:uncharacterized protein LOC133532382 [Cydia pomonella]